MACVGKSAYKQCTWASHYCLMVRSSESWTNNVSGHWTTLFILPNVIKTSTILTIWKTNKFFTFYKICCKDRRTAFIPSSVLKKAFHADGKANKHGWIFKIHSSVAHYHLGNWRANPIYQHNLWKSAYGDSKPQGRENSVVLTLHTHISGGRLSTGNPYWPAAFS